MGWVIVDDPVEIEREVPAEENDGIACIRE